MCYGNELYAISTSIICNIRVISEGCGFTEAIKKLGIERKIFTKGKYKFVLDTFQDIKQENIQEHFKNIVKTYRKEKLQIKCNPDIKFILHKENDDDDILF